jgi:hypothetical protein
MKEVFKFIVAILIYVYCLPIVILSLLKVLWRWDLKVLNKTIENIEELILSIVELH